MKILFTILTALVLSASVFAQAPEKMSYQAVVRNSNEQLVINTQIGIQISILQGSENGTEVYSELQHPSTNDNGLISIAIGVGDSEDNFSDIDWSSGPFFIKTEVDISGGSNYSITGISQLLSVPYAFYAKTADALSSEIEENDPVFESSAANDITEDDIDSWNKKLDDYTETQSIADVAAIDNNVNTQLKNLLSPTDDNDAVTKAYVDSLLEKLKNLEALIVNAMDVMVDIDGNYYNTVQIGNQIWIVENLRTTKYNDGTSIPTYTDMYEWKDLSTGAYCWYDNDKTANAYTYGALYNWYAVETGKLCPAGWHVPSDDEVKILEEYVGVSPDDLDDHWRGDNAGSKLAGKASLWDDGSLKEDAEFNSSGFTAVPGGYRRGDTGAYVNLNGSANYWTSTPNLEDNGSAWYRAITNFWTTIGRDNRDKGQGYSVRCLKD